MVLHRDDLPPKLRAAVDAAAGTSGSRGRESRREIGGAYNMRCVTCDEPIRSAAQLKAHDPTHGRVACVLLLAR